MKSLFVILPVHNGRKNLDKIVKLLLELIPQLVQQFQIIMIDNGSVDGSAKVAQDVQARFIQIEVIYHPHHQRGHRDNQRRLGPGQARIQVHSDQRGNFRKENQELSRESPEPFPFNRRSKRGYA
ncbi:MAG: glycosyltransferase [Planctomycetota bacterium]|nr:glycosyltransferase [Planctomycetota bacterium]